MTKSLEEEQAHFDVAFDAREASRQLLNSLAEAAGGPAKVAAMVKKDGAAMAEKLGAPDTAVAFGRFELGDECFYVGNHSIMDDDSEVLVSGWKAKAAEPFYEATVGDSRGVSFKRSFTTDCNEVVSFEDIVFEELAQRVEELSGQDRWGVNDALLKDLEKGRSGEMTDIVRTIHAAQYALIRQPMDQALLVQGGPGTGKTAVALHRISWLLYNESDLAPEDVLVVGPNPIFTRYIRKVLPDLGDQDVRHQSLRDLGPLASSRREEDPATAAVKASSRMATLLRIALRQRVRLSERADRLQVGGPGGPAFSRSEIESQVQEALERSTYNGGRVVFRNFIARESGRRTRSGVSITASSIDAAVDRIWPSHTPQSFLQELLGSREALSTAAGDDFTAREVQTLWRQSSEKISDERWSDSDVALLDELEDLIQGRRLTFKHIVVDEAQDLSPMQWRAVRRRATGESYTIVGDLAQGTYEWSPDSWDVVGNALTTPDRVQIAELELGYRVPRQIFELAAQLLPFAAPDLTPPRVVREGPADPDLSQQRPALLADAAVMAAREHAANGRFVGVICTDEDWEGVTDAFEDRGVVWGDAAKGELSSSINVLNAAESKGLEFDAVVVVDPEAIVKLPRGHRLLYIAMTRATQYLTVVHTGSPLGLPTEDSSPVAVPTIEDDAPPLPAHAPMEPHELTSAPGLTTSLPAAAVSAGGGFATGMARLAAQQIGADMRATLAPHLWPIVLDLLREELGRD